MATTFMTNDQWAIRKGYSQFASNGTTGYLDDNTTPIATQLDAYRDDAYALITRRIGSTSSTDTDFLLSLEYRVVEALRMYDVAIKRGDLELLLQTINQLLNIIPSEQAQDLSLDAEDSTIQRGTTSG